MTLDKLWSDSFSLRIGRQEIVAGNELHLGDNDFYAGLSHDGGVGTWDFDNVDVMVWYTRPVESAITGGGTLTPDLVGTVIDTNLHFWGGYADWTFRGDQTFDVYAMNVNGPLGALDLDVWTVGGRYAHDKTDSNGFIWNIEYAQQFGDATSTVDAEGSVLEGWLGYNMARGDNVHRIYGRYSQATGDDATTTEHEGFIPMFGDFHNRTGRGDWFQLADATTGLGGVTTFGGLTAFSVGYNGFYNDRHEFGAAFWTYTLEEDSGAASGDDLGDSIDIWYGFNYSRNVNFVVSLSQLSPDDALTGVGGVDDDVTRVYGQARVRF